METIKAFAMGRANRGKEKRVFDWNKAASIIKDRGAKSASAGLSGDLEWTCGTILSDGKPVTDSYTYLSSTWAEPVLIIDGEEIPCWSMESEVPNFDSDTKWPAVALEIINEAKEKTNGE